VKLSPAERVRKLLNAEGTKYIWRFPVETAKLVPLIESLERAGWCDFDCTMLHPTACRLLGYPVPKKVRTEPLPRAVLRGMVDLTALTPTVEQLTALGWKLWDVSAAPAPGMGRFVCMLRKPDS
jgi:hypothetical protein